MSLCSTTEKGQTCWELNVPTHFTLLEIEWFWLECAPLKTQDVFTENSLTSSSRWHKDRPSWGQPLCLLPLTPNGDLVRDSLWMAWQRFTWAWIPKAKPSLNILCVAHSPPVLQTLQWLRRKTCLSRTWWDKTGVKIKQLIKKQKPAVSTDRELPFSHTRLGLCSSLTCTAVSETLR